MAFSSSFVPQNIGADYKHGSDLVDPEHLPILSHDSTMVDTSAPSLASSAIPAPIAAVSTHPQHQHQQHQQSHLMHTLSQLQISSLASPTPLQHSATMPQIQYQQQQQQQQQLLLQQSRLHPNDYMLALDSPLTAGIQGNYPLQTQYFASSAPQSATSPTHAAAAAAGPAQLWMGDIESWMSDDCIRQLWARVGELVSVKMIRDRLTGSPANYCFIEVASQADAERVLALFNGKPMPAPFDRPFRLNWASSMAAPAGPSAASTGIYPSSAYQLFSEALDGAAVSAAAFPNATSFAGSAPTATANGDGPKFSLFVGDLAPEVTDAQLTYEFRRRYSSVRSAKIVNDLVTLLPRGFGFVHFADEAEQQRALVEMQGRIIGTRAIRVSLSTSKRTPTLPSLQQQQSSHYAESGAAAVNRNTNQSPAPSDASLDSNEIYNPATDPDNTTVFVGGLVNPVGEDELYAFFAVYGDVDYCKIPPNRGCGFVTFAKRANAETAMRALNGHILGGSRVRLSWGRSQSHARHNYRNHHHHYHHHHHHRHQNSNGGSNSSGTNSHRNSVSEQHNLLARRSVSLGKSSVALAPTAAPSTALGLGLSGASLATTAHGVVLLADSAESKYPPANSASATATSAAIASGGAAFSAHSAPLHSSTMSHASAAAAQPSPGPSSTGFANSASFVQQQQPVYGATSHSAFYAASPIHPNANSAAVDSFGGLDSGTRVGSALAQPLAGYHHYQQQQQQQSYYYSQQDPLMISTPLSAHAPGIGDSPLFTAHYNRQQQQPPQQPQQPQHALSFRNSGQFDNMLQVQQQQQQQQHPESRDVFGSGALLPSLSACPSELLTRRLSALTLGGSARNVSSDSQSLGPSASAVGLANPHPLDRRPSV
ncbi:hypothetical protein H4R99_008138, partial [Coemansia sp. RSA 1722]